MSDFVGRFITHWITVSLHCQSAQDCIVLIFPLQVGSHRLVLFIASALRVLFVPLVLLCNFRNRDDPVFNSDVIPVVLVTFLGLTNGYLGSTAMISAPQ